MHLVTWGLILVTLVDGENKGHFIYAKTNCFLFLYHYIGDTGELLFGLLKLKDGLCFIS